MRNSIIAALLCGTPAALPAQTNTDIVVAESILLARKIGSESADAAMDRANAAMLSVLSTSPDKDVILRGWDGVKECFQRSCATERSLKPGHRFFKTDEQLKLEGCLTRTESVDAKCEGFTANCFEPVPQNVGQVADERVIDCITNDASVGSFRDRLYDLFFDEEVKMRFDALEPKQRDVVQPHLGPTDV